MDKGRKTVLYIFGGAIGLMVMVLLVPFIMNNQYSSKIPKIPESQTLSGPVKEQISDALTRATRKPSADNLGRLGMVYHSSANYSQAAQCYKLAVKRNKAAWIWNYYLGYLFMEMGDSEAVIEIFNSVIEKNPNVYHAWYYMGEEYKNLRKNEQAERSFGEITAIQPENPTGKGLTRYDYFPLGTYAMFQMSRIYFDSGRMDLAEKTLKEIIQTNRSFGPAYRLLGNIYNVKGETQLGEWYGVRANDLVVFAPPVDTLVDRLVLMSRSELYLLKKIDEAEKSIYPEWAMKLVSHAIKYLPDNKYLISKAIRISLMSNSDQLAILLTEQHINDFQGSFTEMNNMGMLFFQKRLYPQSIKYFTRAIAIRPADTEIQNCLAICYWSMGDKQKSQDILDVLFKDHQDNPDVLANTTNLLFDLGEDEKAMGYFARLKQLSPAHPKVLKMSGEMAEKNGKLSEAISLYERSFKGDPEDLSTIRFLDNLLIKQKLWSKVIDHYRAALEYHPNEPYLLERLGTMLVTCPDPALRNMTEGRDYSERAFIHTTSRSMTLISAGRSLSIAYAALGDNQNAYNILNMTIQLRKPL